MSKLEGFGYDFSDKIILNRLKFVVNHLLRDENLITIKFYAYI